MQSLEKFKQLTHHAEGWLIEDLISKMDYTQGRFVEICIQLDFLKAHCSQYTIDHGYKLIAVNSSLCRSRNV